MGKRRLFLFCWQQPAAEALAAELRQLGWEVDLEWQDGGRGSRAARQQPPDLLLFDLSQRPSHSWATAKHLSETPATRAVPLLFLNGSPAAIAETQERIPRAVFIRQEDLQTALESYA
ncbi:MAG: hypothetical protein KIS80_08245 [Anaerolineales bacterium]|nr:hypothetical protein [Anaerolineales bacterium]